MGNQPDSNAPPRDLRSVLDAVPDGIVVVDADGRVEALNVEASRILGVSAAQARGRPLGGLAGGPRLDRLVRTALSRRASAAENEVELSAGPEGALVVDLAAAPLVDGAGSADGAVLVVRDRTLGKALRDLWSERERLADFGRIAAGIAHEVKNPLGGIRGAAELLAARAETDKNRETAELVVREVDRISSLIDDLLTFSRSETVRLAPVNLHRVLDDVLDLLAMDAASAKVEVVRQFDPSLPELLADGDRLVQVFLNLGRNAVEAMAPGGGRLAIRTRVSLDARLAPGGGPPVPVVLVDVEDDGPGIPADLRARVTTPFVTTKPQGSGLGLALAQHFVALHGGRLQIGPGPERGTRVRTVLPLRRSA